mmetsp:Transcript_9331/g.14049  ORF Transcript_9331/g.14049 Transcript_9331/m.14049 type:complete len:243 (+) Transcript_9331:113-841(+)
MCLWSQVMVTVISLTVVKLPSGLCTTVGKAPPMAKMDPAPTGKSAPKSETPNIPKLEMKNVPELYSSAFRDFFLAFITSSFHFAERSSSERRFAFGRTGVINPPSIATAIETLISFLYTICPGAYAAFTIGCDSKAKAAAFASRALTVTPKGFSCLYKSSKASVLMRLETLKTGTSMPASIFLATAFCIPSMALGPSGKSGTSLYEGTLVASTDTALTSVFSSNPKALFTSSSVTRLKLPVP